MMRSLFYGLVLLGGSAAATLSYGLDLPAEIRVPAALFFVLVCPGLALLRLAHPYTAGENPLALAVALSISIGLLGTTAMTSIGWSSGAFFGALAGLSTIAGVRELTAGASERIAVAP